MDNKKKIILSVLVALLILAIGVAYAFFTYESGTKSDIVTGQIYMNYEETSTISLTGVFPETKAQALARQDENGVFEFTITGRNTSDKPVYYEIDLLDGGVITGKDASSTKILPEHVMIYLERDGEPLIDGMTYQDFNNRRIWVETVPANQSTNIEHKYTLRMWIDENVTISDTDTSADYTTSEWNSAYASLKVRVVGDFEVKKSPYNYMTRFGVTNLETYEFAFWPENIEAEKGNIISIDFVQMDQNTMLERYNASTIKADVTDITKSEAGSVLAWLETDTTDSTKYKMYVASDEITYFPSDSSGMFSMVSVMMNGDTPSLSAINFENIDTKYVTNMSAMFMACTSLTDLDVSGFNLSNTTTIEGMFSVSGIINLDLSNWDVSNIKNMDFLVNESLNMVTLDMSGWVLAKDVSMYEMFSEIPTLTTLILSDWDVSNVSNMNGLFSGCTGLIGLDLSNWDVSNVTDMSNMFAACSSLTSLDLSSFDTAKVVDMSNMFGGCINLKTIYSNTDWNTENVSSSTNMFYNCPELVGAVPFDATKTDITMANPDTGYFTRKEV